MLPLIRTRAELYRWSASNAHGSQVHQAVDILEAAIPISDQADAYKVTHKALAKARSACRLFGDHADPGGVRRGRVER